jgi:hypothetical protein
MDVAKTVFTCVAAACLTGTAAAEPPAPAGPVRIGSVFVAGLVRRAMEGAAHRLDAPGCQRIFTEFQDRDGRTLADNLAALGDDGRAFLGRLLFYDAGDHQLCARGALAITHPNSRVVLVCAGPFQRAYFRDPALAEAVIIHEALHGLGLGENPPTSQAITARVLNRCGRQRSRCAHIGNSQDPARAPNKRGPRSSVPAKAVAKGGRRRRRKR